MNYTRNKNSVNTLPVLYGTPPQHIKGDFIQQKPIPKRPDRASYIRRKK